MPFGRAEAETYGMSFGSTPLFKLGLSYPFLDHFTWKKGHFYFADVVCTYFLPCILTQSGCMETKGAKVIKFHVIPRHEQFWNSLEQRFRHRQHSPHMHTRSFGYELTEFPFVHCLPIRYDRIVFRCSLSGYSSRAFAYNFVFYCHSLTFLVLLFVH